MPNKLCMICLDSLENTNNINLPKCNHILHSSCFCEYIQKRNGYEINCPVCREEILCIYPHIVIVPVNDVQYRPPKRILEKTKKII